MRVFIGMIICLFTSFQGFGQLVINEVLSGNVDGLMDEDGEFNDWMEIYNAGGSTVDISGYTLTDDLLEPTKWTFPEMELAGHDHILVFASGKDRKNLNLSYQTVIDLGDEWSYLVPLEDMGTDWQTAGYDASSWGTSASGFGYGDDDDATDLGSVLSVYIRKEFSLEDIASIERLFLDVDYDDAFVAYINGVEVARSMLGTAGNPVSFDQTADDNHEAMLYQGGSPERYEVSDLSMLVEGLNVIAIEGHNLSSSSSDLTLIPFLTKGTLSGGNQVSPYLSYILQAGIHTNFKIKAEGESLYLFDHAGSFIDSIAAINIPATVSYGRKPDGSDNFVFFGVPTPGAENNTSGSLLVEANPVIFSKIGGKYIGGTSIILSSEASTDSIYYTTDGSVPTTESALYAGPISLSGDGVVRARVIKSGVLPGPVITNTYVTQYDHQIPVVCISTNPGNLWDDETGIYVLGTDYESASPHYGANYWEDWERPVHFEFYDSEGQKQVDQGAGIKIMGGWSRMAEQKSVVLYARKDYGKGSFEYKFFDGKPIEKFEAIVLRNSGNDNMVLQFHDAFMTGLTRNMDVDRQAAQPAAVYINGEYWGIMNIREKVNEHYLADNHGVNEEDINIVEYQSGVVYGTNEGYLDILSFLNGHSTLSNNDDYTYVADQIDLDNYIQYQATQIFLNNQDWPGNNIKYWNTNTGGKWRWILYDTDFGFQPNEYGENTLAFALATNGPSWPNPPWSTLLFRRMTSNLEFRYNFITQFCDRLNLDFSPDRVRRDLDSLRGVYYADMAYHFSRWWGSYSQWETRITQQKTFGSVRPSRVRLHMQNQFNLQEELDVSLAVSDVEGGKIRINTIFPYEYPFEGIYFKDIPITLKAVPEPGYKFVRWEGANNTSDLVIEYDMADDASFTAVFEEASAEDVSIVINEINYSSSDSWDTKDWVEFVNNGSATVDMEGWLFSDSGPDTGFYFPAGIALPTGSYLVLCKDLKDFKELNPGVFNAIGDMPFGLSSGGENLRLYDTDGNIIDAVNYTPYAPWPANALGTGATIELIEPSLDNMQGENWLSVTYGGTPGGNNSGYDAIEQKIMPDLLPAFESFPNPFTDYTTIQFTVAEAGHYKLEIFDINGQLIEVLADEYLLPDTYSMDWHGQSSPEGRNGGFFTLRLASETDFETIKLVMIK
ncbi:MAG: CotH kinase family protein [Bacteroidales bacterium]|nr:CotH kinase family protein [Bacteroidales bacterium]